MKTLTVSKIEGTGRSCNVTISLKQYSVTASITGGSLDATSKTVNHGSNATFTVTASTYYDITRASVSGTGCTLSSDKKTLTVSKIEGTGRSCSVTIPLKQYTVSASISGGSLDTTSKTVNHGSNATFTITASTNYDLSRASVTGTGCTLSSDKKILTVSNIVGSGRSCAVTIPLKQYTLTMIVNNGSTSPSSAVINHGGSKAYTISASTGYTTTGMTVTCKNNSGTVTSATKSISGSTVTIGNIVENQTCTVSTVKKTYAVKVSSNNTSYGTVSPTSTTITHGNSATITLSPATGYKYSSNTCGGTVSGNTMTISNVTEAKTCTVTFAIKTYTVSVSVTNGSSNYGSRTVNHGSNTTFTITPSSGYKLDGATVSGTGCSLSGSTLTVSNVTSSVTCNIKLDTKDVYHCVRGIPSGTNSNSCGTTKAGTPIKLTCELSTGQVTDLETKRISGTGTCKITGTQSFSGKIFVEITGDENTTCCVSYMGGC